MNLHVVQDETCKKTLTEEQEIISRKSSNWFQEDQFLVYIFQNVQKL